MISPSSAKAPCKNCQQQHAIYTNGEVFWKWDPEVELFRIVDYTGYFYPLESHPGATHAQLIANIEGLQLANEYDILWRTARMILEGLTVMFPGMPK